MRATSALFFLTALVGGIHAQDENNAAQAIVGTFDTFRDNQCRTGGSGTTIRTPDQRGRLPYNAKSIKAYIQQRNCV
ncbi:hypothetical protein G3M48_008587, partial [Beauveria asiatica]